MIYWFSGTGNSRFAAEKIARLTGQTLYSLNGELRAARSGSGAEGEALVFVVPTYAWRIPSVVEEWIGRSALGKGSRTWFVMTCGGQIGNAGKYNRLLCEKKGLQYMGTAQIIMPENYIAMFDAPEEAEAARIIARAEPEIEKAAGQIRAGAPFPADRHGPVRWALSALGNPYFYRVDVKADGFSADEKCIACGKCERLCPLNNIRLSDGKPVWGQNCTQCMACICHCPTEAIEYGRKSVGKPRYRCGSGIE